MSRESKAADRLEALVPELARLIADLREGKPQPYARAYTFRWRVSQIVATLGSGNPGMVRPDPAQEPISGDPGTGTARTVGKAAGSFSGPCVGDGSSIFERMGGTITNPGDG